MAKKVKTAKSWMPDPGCRYVVQAWHYAQFEVTAEGPDGTDVEILDEDDCNLAIVAVRDSVEEAEAAARAYDETCVPSHDDEDMTGQPVCAINIYEVPASGPPREGRFVKSVVDNSTGGG